MDCLREQLEELHGLQAAGMPREGVAEALANFTEVWESSRMLSDARHGQCHSCAVALIAYTLNDGEWMLIQDVTGLEGSNLYELCPAEKAKIAETID